MSEQGVENVTQIFEAVKMEYEILRKEMHALEEAKWKLECAMFSIYGLLLAYLITLKEALPSYFLIPIPIILLFYKIHYDFNLGIWSGAAFCCVFFTDKGFLWENRLMKYREQQNHFKKNKSLFLPITITEYLYGIPCYICIGLYIWKYYMCDDPHLPGIIYGIILSIGLLTFFKCRKLFGMPPFEQIFLQHVKGWTTVKEGEDKRGRENSSTRIHDVIQA